MDYETKIYLDKLVEAVDKLDSPDWWIIILTIVNIGAFVFVAITQIKLQKQQTKLQEQQNKQQEYDLYSRLYESLCDMNTFADTLIYKIYATISYSNDTNGIRDCFMKLFEEVNDLHSQLNKCSVDVDLKWAEQNKAIKEYYKLIISSRNLLVFLIKMVNAEKIKACNSIANLNNDDTESLIKFIVKQCDSNIASETYKMLNNYSGIVNAINNINILTKIKERCKID